MAEPRQLEAFKSRHVELGTRGEDEGEDGNDDTTPDRYSHDSAKGSPVERVVDPTWIDVEVIKLWAETCDQRHGTHCRSRHPDTATPPTWLIDVSAACLVRGAPDMAYVALSYIWGDAVGGQAYKDNLARLQQLGALLADDMPRTIRDVIRLLPLIGERYLWVDRLCIVQDDEQHKAVHIDRMVSIYYNARMKLVHALGDGAGYGLRARGRYRSSSSAGACSFSRPTAPSGNATATPYQGVRPALLQSGWSTSAPSTSPTSSGLSIFLLGLTSTCICSSCRPTTLAT